MDKKEEMEKKLYWYWLNNISGIGTKKIEALLAFFEKPEHIYHADKEALDKVPVLREKDVASIMESRDMGKVRKKFALLQEKGIRFLSREDEEFPEKLRHIYNAPWGLYARGKKLCHTKYAIAIVGARNCSAYGMQVARGFAEKLACAGFVIVSGMARGIDIWAHRGALQGGGLTCAVLGSGIDVCYPPSHIETYMHIQESGTILSEYNIGYPSRQYNFPMRNRIISGLADAVLVVEAREKSGSLITANLGLEQGKNIFAVPGRITDVLSRGCNALIQAGAYPVTKAEDILEYYDIPAEKIRMSAKKYDNMLEKEEKIVYASLGLIPKAVNEIIMEAGMPAADILPVLVSLELKGYVKQCAPGYFVADSGNMV